MIAKLGNKWGHSIFPVLLLSDRVDEWLTGNLTHLKRSLLNIGRHDPDLYVY